MIKREIIRDMLQPLMLLWTSENGAAY